MCLSINWSENEKNVWLKYKPDTITAYKVVNVEKFGRFGRGRKASPPFFESIGAYTKTNIIEQEMEAIFPGSRGAKYLPHFHLFLDRGAAVNWAKKLYDINVVILKCEIPKNQITTIGTQEGFVTIVTKGFTFVEGDEYFTE